MNSPEPIGTEDRFGRSKRRLKSLNSARGSRKQRRNEACSNARPLRSERTRWKHSHASSRLGLSSKLEGWQVGGAFRTPRHGSLNRCGERSRGLPRGSSRSSITCCARSSNLSIRVHCLCRRAPAMIFTEDRTALKEAARRFSRERSCSARHANLAHDPAERQGTGRYSSETGVAPVMV